MHGWQGIYIPRLQLRLIAGWLRFLFMRKVHHYSMPFCCVPLLGWMLSTEFDDEKTQLIDDGIVTRASFQNHLVFDYNIDMMAFYLISLMFVTGLWYITRSAVYSNHF
jgi:hypothetical protein